MKIISKILSFITVSTLLFSVMLFPASAAEKLDLDLGCLRFIKNGYLGTLAENSKWREEDLNTLLNETLSNDLSDTSECVQVWKVPSNEFRNIHEWCSSRDKGFQTNQDFLFVFSAYRVN